MCSALFLTPRLSHLVSKHQDGDSKNAALKASQLQNFTTDWVTSVYISHDYLVYGSNWTNIWHQKMFNSWGGRVRCVYQM